MNKFVLLSGFSFLLITAISAQENETGFLNNDAECSKNFFAGVGLRTNVYVNDNARNDFNVWKSPTLGASVFAGKWFSYYFGGRVTLESGKLHSYFQKKTIMTDEGYASARVDVLFNLTNSLRPCRCSPKRGYNLIPYVGIGGISAFNAKNRPDTADGSTSILFGGGLLNSFKLSHKFFAFLNLGLDVVDASVDGWERDKKWNGIASGSIGVIMDF